MCTPSLIYVFYNGRFVVAQCSQWDGYPEGQGMDILHFLLNSDNIERLKNGLQHIITLSAEMVEHITARNAAATQGGRPTQHTGSSAEQRMLFYKRICAMRNYKRRTA